MFDDRWLEPGTFVSSIVNSDKVLRRRDLDDESFRRAATIVVSTRDQIKNDEPIWLTEGIANGAVTWDRIWKSASWCAARRRAGRTAAKSPFSKTTD